MRRGEGMGWEGGISCGHAGPVQKKSLDSNVQVTNDCSRSRNLFFVSFLCRCSH